MWLRFKSWLCARNNILVAWTIYYYGWRACRLIFDISATKLTGNSIETHCLVCLSCDYSIRVFEWLGSREECLNYWVLYSAWNKQAEMVEHVWTCLNKCMFDQTIVQTWYFFTLKPYQVRYKLCLVSSECIMLGGPNKLDHAHTNTNFDRKMSDHFQALLYWYHHTTHWCTDTYSTVLRDQ